jgi:hypothetical protein
VREDGAARLMPGHDVRLVICESLRLSARFSLDRNNTTHVSQQMFPGKEIGFQGLGKPHE